MPSKNTIVCGHCGTPFTAKPSEGRLFCKRACYTAHRQAQQPTRVCQQCGVEFRTSQYFVDHDLAKYCSEACQHAHNRIPVADRFWAKVQKTDTCWLWMAARDGGGYGRIGNGKGGHSKAHRVAYELAYGPIPEGLDICHHCDCPSCVRPDHLFAGSVSDNMRDAVSKGRKGGQPRVNYRGEHHHNAKLNEDDVREIRALAANGSPHTHIAARFGITAPTVDKIVYRQRWKHVE